MQGNRADSNAEKQTGDSLLIQGKLKRATEAYRRAVAMNPNSPSAHNGLGLALTRAGLMADAAESFAEAARLSPGNPFIQVNLGHSLRKLAKLDEAETAYRTAIRIQPDLADAWIDLGRILESRGGLKEAAECYANAIPTLPGPSAWNRACLLASQGLPSQSIGAAEQAQHFVPGDPAIHSGLLYLLLGSTDASRQEVFHRHLTWADLHCRHLSPTKKEFKNPPDPERRIRIAYMSPDFRLHSAMRVFEPLVARHRRDRFEITCYHLSPRSDPVTERLRALVDRWRDLSRTNDDHAAKQIEKDEIDILIDLSGHMPGNRLPVFARRPAPIQVSYYVYNHTTGIDAIQYRLTDAYQAPPADSQDYYVEKLIRLDPISWCYSPWNDVSAEEPERTAEAPVVFGSMNDPRKMNEAVIETWAAILTAVPDSTLVFQTADADSAHDAIVRGFVAQGIERKRLAPTRRLKLETYLRTLSRIDVALDPFPYNGHITTCDTLWMGTPVVTLEGSSAVGRIGRTILAELGMHDCIASDREGYILRAVRLSDDRDYLKQTRSALRQRMVRSSLMDYQGLVARLETALERMWRDWCATRI
jgi:protein O-GlcNAc transferase